MPHQHPLESPSTAAVAEFLERQDQDVVLAVAAGAMKNQDLETLRILDSMGAFDDPAAQVKDNAFGSVVHVARGVLRNPKPEIWDARLAGDAFAGPLSLVKYDAAFSTFVRELFDRFVAAEQPSDAVVARFLVAATVLRDVEMFKSFASHLSAGLGSLHEGRSLWVPLYGEFYQGEEICHPVVYALAHGLHAILDLYLKAGWRPGMTSGDGDAEGTKNGFYFSSGGTCDAVMTNMLIDSCRGDDGKFIDTPHITALHDWAGSRLQWWALDSDSHPLNYQVTELLKPGLYETNPKLFFSWSAYSGGTRVCAHLEKLVDWTTMRNPLRQPFMESEHWAEDSKLCRCDPRPAMTEHAIALAKMCVDNGRPEFLSEVLPWARIRKADQVIEALLAMGAKDPGSPEEEIELSSIFDEVESTT